MPQLHEKHARTLPALLVISLIGCTPAGSAKSKPEPPRVESSPAAPSPGALMRVTRDGQPGAFCPLKHTDVQAEISGFLARVTVTQEFENNTGEKIEAVYTFPLSQRAAVDEMSIQVGERTVRGLIKKREEARAIYEAARARGHVAGLLDQERPNIFTQSVTNIGPGMRVKVVIGYVEVLPYEGGTYEFSFPMVVGPRYIPASMKGSADAARISPPVTPEGTRAGHDISLGVRLDAGLALESVASKTHEVDVERPAAARAIVRLRQRSVLPNKDFVLRYDVAGRKIQDSLLVHRDRRGGFFTLILQPPERATPAEVTPKELVFVMDSSGSMSGFPIEKAKEVIKLALDNLYPRDTFNLITFAGDTHVLFPAPVPASTENIEKAQRFLLSRSGGGGTEMMKAIRTALEPSDSREHVRVVCFLTDGYVGNDMEILGEIRRHPNARIFSFGIGSSVNRFLLDKMAEESRGEVEYVGLNDDGSKAARRFHERVRNPLLTDLSVDWGGLPVSDVYPRRIPDLFDAKPVVLSGRFSRAANGVARLRGRAQGRDFSREINIRLPEQEPAHEVLATLWARTRVDALMREDWTGMQSGNPKAEIRDEITQIGLDYRLMTQFTSFVAVEESIVTEGGQPRLVQVPVEMPEGVSYEGVFGNEESKTLAIAAAPMYRGMAGKAGGVLPSFSRQNAAEAVTAPQSAVRDEARRTPAGEEYDALPGKDHSKLDASLQQALRRHRSGNASSAAFKPLSVRDGKVRVKVWLSKPSWTARAAGRLRELGLEVGENRWTDGFVTGYVAFDKLEALAGQPEVLFVSADLGTP